MTETISPQEAARAFVQASRWEHSIRYRTEGLTWMIWGAITPGLIVTMGFVGVLELPSWAQMLSWPPWVLTGYGITHALWTTSALHRPELAAPRLGSYVINGAVVIVLVLVLHFILQPDTMAWPLALIGGGWMALGLLNRRLSRQGRRAAAVAGATIMVGAVGLSLAGLPGLEGMLVAAGVAGLAPLSVGFVQALSG